MTARLLLTALALTAIAACGGGERTFTASEFVEEMNDKGANLKLGGNLLNDQEGIEVFELRFARSFEGSLVVAEDIDVGVSEYERCESAATLLCYRAANVVMLFDEAEISVTDLAPVETALTALGGD